MGNLTLFFYFFDIRFRLRQGIILEIYFYVAGVLVLCSTITLLFFRPYSNVVGCNGLLELLFFSYYTLIIDARGV